MVVVAALICCRISATAAADEGNAVERTAKKATKAVQKTGKRALNAVERGAKAADKALTNAGEKTEAWVKRQTR